ncbi:MAG: hypothetical protein WD737_07895 [Gemmatimonadota bacterium]
MKMAVGTLLLAVLAAGCTKEPLQFAQERPARASGAEVRTSNGGSFRLRPGESAVSAGGEILVLFREVAADSRCPQDVTCVWEGDAEAVVGIAVEGGWWSWHTLHTNLEPRSVRAHGHVVTLADLEPPALSDAQISQADYVAVLRIELE